METETTAVRSPGAARMARYRARRRKGLRCLLIELTEAEVGALIRRGFVYPGDRPDPAAIRRGLYAFLADHLR